MQRCRLKLNIVSSPLQWYPHVKWRSEMWPVSPVASLGFSLDDPGGQSRGPSGWLESWSWLEGNRRSRGGSQNKLLPGTVGRDRTDRLGPAAAIVAPGDAAGEPTAWPLMLPRYHHDWVEGGTGRRYGLTAGEGERKNWITYWTFAKSHFTK